jgi:hypothetical protein
MFPCGSSNNTSMNQYLPRQPAVWIGMSEQAVRATCGAWHVRPPKVTLKAALSVTLVTLGGNSSRALRSELGELRTPRRRPTPWPRTNAAYRARRSFDRANVPAVPISRWPAREMQ